jgi:hypothetical protein
VKLAEHNRIQLVWVPGHMGIDGNEIADQLARQGFSHSLIGPEPALGISAKVARGETGQVGNMWSIGRPYVGKARLRVFFKKKKKNSLIAQSEQKPTKNNDKVANRTLSFKRTPL